MYWGGRGLTAGLSVLALLSAPAVAQVPQGAGANPDGGVPTVQGELSVSNLLGQSGRVASPQMKQMEISIALDKAPPAPADVNVEVIAPRERDAEQGFIDPDELSADVLRLFEKLRTCRLDVARERRVPISELALGLIQLDWRISRGGSASDITLRPQSQVDPLLIKCARRHLANWLFTRPRGGEVPVSYTFSFFR